MKKSALSGRSIILLCILFISCSKNLQNKNALVPVSNEVYVPFMQRTVVPVSYTSDKNQDSTTLQLPSDYYNDSASADKYPVIIFLNGTGEAADDGNLNQQIKMGPPKLLADSVRLEFTVNGTLFRNIIICPQSSNGYRTTTSINRIIDYAIATYRVDTNRVYLTGLSSGAFNIWKYLTESQYNANRIAAATPLSTQAIDSTSKVNIKYIALSNAHVRAWVGDKDNVAIYNKNNIDILNSLNPGHGELTYYNGDHCCWNNIYYHTDVLYKPNLYEWMLQYHK